MKHIFLILVIIMIYSCNENDKDKSKMLGDDYRLYKGTSFWELAKATKADDFEKMEELVKEQKLDINKREAKFGQTLLFISILNGQVDACAKLLSLGADPNLHETYKDRTPLILAANLPNDEISLELIKFLLKYGANINEIQTNLSRRIEYPDSKPLNSTALITACSDIRATSNPLPKVKFLVEAGANINYIGNGNISPLTECLSAKKYDIALYLLEKGANYKQLFWEHNKYEENKPTYILDYLRQQVFNFDSKEYKYKMKVVDFLKTKGLDYWQHPVHPEMVKEIKRLHPENWEEYLEKY
ncbi:MAG: ankyrin repeat domain-containing protein [Bacteroidetes bacterium]|nr:ankyrin repeat domain-containing protein [Bacteroidota bacterium]